MSKFYSCASDFYLTTSNFCSTASDFHLVTSSFYSTPSNSYLCTSDFYRTTSNFHSSLSSFCSLTSNFYLLRSDFHTLMTDFYSSLNEFYWFTCARESDILSPIFKSVYFDSSRYCGRNYLINCVHIGQSYFFIPLFNIQSFIHQSFHTTPLPHIHPGH